MTFVRQALLTIAVIAAVLVLWARFVPASQPWLDRIGLLQPMTQIGIVATPPTEGAAPAARGGPPGGGARPPVRVIATQPVPTVMNDLVTAIGTAQALRSVVVSPEVKGKVVRLYASPGDKVQSGDLLVELDSQAARIAVDRAGLVLRDAQATVARLERLTTSGAVSDVQRQDAELALRTAELGERQAAYDLAQHRITAPIAGWIGILGLDVGDQVSPGDMITQIDDRSRVIVEFRVPERVVRSMALGAAVTATPLGGDGDAVSGTISAIDNRVDVASRSLRVQALVPNADDNLRSGMALSISLALTGDTHPAVDPLAVQWGSDGAFVWILRDGKASQLPVRILQRNSDAVLVRADFQPGDLVVNEGVQSLRPGADAEAVTPGTASADAPERPKT
jgi:RND family efflux transporter MFP subunit